MEATARTATDSIENKATQDQLKIISRLVLQKMMSSDAVRFMRVKNHADVSAQFLSDTPEKEISVMFVGLSDINRPHFYSTGTVDVSLRWILNPEEIVDLEGNLWVTNSLSIKVTFGSAYSVDFESARERFEIVKAVGEMLDEIRELTPKPIRVLSLDNEGRLDRDEKRRCEKIASELSHIFSGSRRSTVTGLRRGGRSRPIERSIIDAIEGMKPGKYTFSINVGSSRRARNRYYVLSVPETAGYLAHVKRID